jgi:hypothetical protein
MFVTLKTAPTLYIAIYSFSGIGRRHTLQSKKEPRGLFFYTGNLNNYFSFIICKIKFEELFCSCERKKGME